MLVRFLRPRLRVAAGVILAIVAGGCSRKSQEVSGTITLDGQPLAGAQVTLVPAGDKTLAPHVAGTDAAGHFVMREKGGSNTPLTAGTYIAVVSKMSAGSGADPMASMKETLPADYQDRYKSPLRVEIKEGAADVPPLALNSKFQSQEAGKGDGAAPRMDP